MPACPVPCSAAFPSVHWRRPFFQSQVACYLGCLYATVEGLCLNLCLPRPVAACCWADPGGSRCWLSCLGPLQPSWETGRRSWLPASAPPRALAGILEVSQGSGALLSAGAHHSFSLPTSQMHKQGDLLRLRPSTVPHGSLPFPPGRTLPLTPAFQFSSLRILSPGHNQ